MTARTTFVLALGQFPRVSDLGVSARKRVLPCGHLQVVRSSASRGRQSERQTSVSSIESPSPKYTLRDAPCTTPADTGSVRIRVE